jgi:hypothetical protein
MSLQFEFDVLVVSFLQFFLYSNYFLFTCVEGPKLIVDNTNNLLNNYSKYRDEFSRVKDLESFSLSSSPPLRQRGCCKSGWTKFQHFSSYKSIFQTCH